MYLVLSNINEKNININKYNKEYILLYELPYVKLNGLFFKINLNNFILKEIINNVFIYYIYIDNDDIKLILKLDSYLKLHINNLILLRKYKDKYFIIARSKNRINKNHIISIKKVQLINGKYIPIIYLNG